METTNNFRLRRDAVGSAVMKAAIAEGVKQRGERRTMERITSVLDGVNCSFVDQLHTWHDSLEGADYWRDACRKEKAMLNAD